MRNILKDNERIDDLQINNLKIIQNTDGFCFGIDSVILSSFVEKTRKKEVVVDLGTGTGIISFLLSVKIQPRKIYGVEIQEEVADMVKRSIQLNNLEDKFEVINCNIKNIEKYIEKSTVDIVVTNPPYKKDNTGGKNVNEKKLISRHEISANIYDFVNATSKVLKDKGTLYMVHRPERLAEIIVALKQYKMEPKIIRFVYSKKESDSSKLVLIKAVKNGGEFLKIEKPLFIYDEDGNYTQEILDIYNSNDKEEK